MPEFCHDRSACGWAASDFFNIRNGEIRKQIWNLFFFPKKDYYLGELRLFLWVCSSREFSPAGCCWGRTAPAGPVDVGAPFFSKMKMKMIRPPFAGGIFPTQRFVSRRDGILSTQRCASRRGGIVSTQRCGLLAQGWWRLPCVKNFPRCVGQVGRESS